ncbi:BZ3500_MvSof-1268-A1-R1_Chr10-1g02726 [Microbotryum saponariae]|uniref:cysteine desulfurase n=1 Tax=Microbotryum saponariae TaxID=289078 RepID=A0A2X0MAM5_9BASI|nr:BZ3500_MvSof-1268-A1-R1_Chr10-1g02726 [Microbotryum saponariae]SDA06215.1 BZ3501_MvSof-1269-A2-R1_Chr10-1g02327 [Microbotryum saponariae]
MSLRRLASTVARASLPRPTPTPTPTASISRLAGNHAHRQPDARHLSSTASRSLATVSDLSLGKDLAIESDQTVHVAPSSDMLGFEMTASPSQSTHAVEGQPVNVGRPIYLDAQATTPTDPRVLDAMLPYMTNQYGNPHSKTHAYGWETEKAVEQGREFAYVADLIGANAKDIIFTSGATESNNMSIKGVARFYKGKKKHMSVYPCSYRRVLISIELIPVASPLPKSITTQTEHKCVLDSCRVLQDEGFDVTYLPVQADGIVDLKLLEESIRPDTVLVSVMMVNNEIGTIQPIKEIGAIVKKHKGVFFHTDAAQAVGKIPINVDEMGIDLMSISGHKIYGPKGIGACYVRRKPRVRLEPIISGGGQERGLRSGTVAAPAVVGFGEACRLAKKEMAFDDAHVRRLSQRLYEGITSKCELIVRNGDPNGYPGCLNLSFSYIEGESMLMAMKDIALSSGSACTSASLEPSYVLRALGTEEDMAHSSIRFGIGRFTTEEEIDFVTNKIVAIVERESSCAWSEGFALEYMLTLGLLVNTGLRDLSPLWEMFQEGIDIKSINW